MNPLSQSHSISLAERICRTISDMNVDLVMVTQETLTDQLVKNYPGIAVPSHNILYNILGTLIKERKIYHTGEGYFIVTPNTYFITNDVKEDNRRVTLEDSCCCSSSSITYLVNIGLCADLVKENIPTVSCYRSCHCFPDQNMLCDKRHVQLVNYDCKGGYKKNCSELRPSIQTQGISESAENHFWATIKSLTSVKQKSKSKRFGLSLFWRSASRKEKRKEEYSTFSAQFPPKEWPVRDEDDLDNIPRDVEHEIIKRINPVLTVDNLIKHTILMQKFEEQKNCISKGTSAEVSVVKLHHLSKDCIQKTQNKTAKQTRKPKSKKEKHISRRNRTSHIHELTSQNQKLEDNLLLPTGNQQPSDVAVASHVIYKKQIKNPFQGLSWRCNFNAKGHKGTLNSQLKSRTQKQERALQRPWSLDSSKTFDHETEQLATKTQADKAKQSTPHANKSSLQLKKDSFSKNFSHPQGSTLQKDNTNQYFLESNILEKNIYRRLVKKNPEDNKTSLHSYTEGNGECKEDAKFSLHLKDEHFRCKADSVCELLDQTANEFQNVHLSNYTANINLVKKPGVKYRQKTGKKNELMFKYDCASHPGSMKLESDGFAGNCHLLYEKAHDSDNCNTLHLDDNSEGKEPRHLPPDHAFSDIRDWIKGAQKVGTAMPLKNCEINTYPIQYDTTVTKHHSGDHGYEESATFSKSIDGSKDYPKPDFMEESYLCRQVLPIGHRKEEKTGLAECAEASAVADFRHTDEADSDADTLQNFIYKMGEEVARCALGSQIKKMRNPLGRKDLFFKNACTVIPGQKQSERTENHSITGDSGIDSPRWTEKKMKLPAKF
ncbi:storkhead-box protein 1 isoform X1 [Neopsephotus bourkii]|uniref:storkhead-box protein 1 isoform X1 n=1 Tax=Neopsephotus bourkii TaxID=309878 RepID=UPI002AA59F94|nr:storkhead-box protein 1 isoform X1 [Neopsephotus bourkii]